MCVYLCMCVCVFVSACICVHKFPSVCLSIYLCGVCIFVCLLAFMHVYVLLSVLVFSTQCTLPSTSTHILKVHLIKDGIEHRPTIYTIV